MTSSDRLDLMVDALDLLGRLSDQQLVIATVLMQAMLSPRRCRSSQEARIQAHVEQLEPEGRDRLAALLAALRVALGGEA